MKYAGLLVLPAGFFLTIGAILLFPVSAQRTAFVLCGLAVEVMGAGGCGTRPHGVAEREPMTPLAPMPFPETSFALTLGLLLLAPLAIAGLALINTGLGRSRSAMQSLLGSLVVISTAVIAFALVGSAIAAGTSGDHAFHLAGKAWNWAGAGTLFLSGFNAAGPRDAACGPV